MRARFLTAVLSNFVFVFTIGTALIVSGCGGGGSGSSNPGGGSGTPVLSSISVTPGTPSIAAGGTQQFTATGTFSDGSKQDLTSSATWSSSATAIATITSGGLATGISAGNTTITATSGAVSGTTTLTVTPPPIPSAPTLSLGFTTKQLQFTWTAATAATFYRVLRNPDGVSGFILNVAQVNAPATSANVDIAVHLENWAAARYVVEACNTTGCTRSNEVTITSGMLAAIGYVKASNPDINDWFGYSVALSGDSNTLAVGAYREDSSVTGIGGDQTNNLASEAGAVYVFVRSASGVWSQQAYVKASNTGSAGGILGDFFGFSVALSNDGNTLAVGAIGESSNATGIGGNQADNSASEAGAVYVFTRSGTVWSQQAYVKASNTGAGDSFGASVSLSSDGNTLAVGAYREDSNATGVGGNQADNSATDAGAVYVFTRSGSTWTQQTYIKASNTNANDWFGLSVAMSGDGSTLAVGAYQEASAATGINGNQADNSVQSAGAVYLY